jgi:deoxyribodipyrimidine photo-lyase
MQNFQPLSVCWFRRDLRLDDQAALYHALKSGLPVLPIFIFDRYILDKLPSDDLRVSFLHETVLKLDTQLKAFGSSLMVFYGYPEEIWKDLLRVFNVKKVFVNEDFESYAKERDQKINNILQQSGIDFIKSKDHVIFKGDEVLKQDGSPYTVFSPYARKWREKLDSLKDDEELYYLKPYSCKRYASNYFPVSVSTIPDLASMGFRKKTFVFPTDQVTESLIRAYDQTRNFPAIHGTSRLGIHFRFGTISIREKAKKALRLNDTFVNELIWRDFYSQILYHFPHVEHEPFRPDYKRIPWRNSSEDFERWCSGQTGYPLVDAGMRELNESGHMHNRVRMITASFLTKHLLIDYRLGEAYFAEKLLDFDLASNNGGWQWAAGCGTDAAPYFRIFNPDSQAKKFDSKNEYIRRWVPEFGSSKYPLPMVEHAFARQRCLETYKLALAR